MSHCAKLYLLGAGMVVLYEGLELRDGQLAPRRGAVVVERLDACRHCHAPSAWCSAASTVIDDVSHGYGLRASCQRGPQGLDGTVFHRDGVIVHTDEYGFSVTLNETVPHLNRCGPLF